MDYRATTYQEANRSRRCVSYSLTEDPYTRNPPNYGYRTRSPENWRKQSDHVEPSRNSYPDIKANEFSQLVESMNPFFILDHLESTYAFLKGRDSEITFYNLTSLNEEFVVRLTERKNLICSGFNRNCIAIARDIDDLLEKCQYDFEWTHFTRREGTKRVVVYQKIYFDQRQSFDDDRETNLVYSPDQEKLLRNQVELTQIERQLAADRIGNQTYRSSNEAKKLDALDDNDHSIQCLSKRQRVFKSLIDSMTEAFVMSSMQTVLDFVKDDSRKLLELIDQTVDEARFLKTLNSFPQKNNLCSLLFTEGRHLASKLRREMDSGMRLIITEGRARGRHRLRNVTVRKQPKKNYKRNVEKETVSDYNPTQMLRSTLSSYNSKSKSIDWCREGRDSAGVSQARDEPRESERGRPTRRTKLMQALSQPIELDKAKGMMEKMGWTGGALGVRGEGITEPIMPALDLKAGAGLGHTNTSRRLTGRSISLSVDPQSPEFRQAILEAILTILRSSRGKTEIALESEASDRDRRFVLDAIDCFNCRKILTSDSEKEKDTASRISADMKNNNKLDLRVEFVNRKMRITKVRTRKRRRERRRRSRSRSNDGSCQNCHVATRHIDSLTAQLADRHPKLSKRTLVALAFRITFLKKIEAFLDDDKDCADVVFQNMLTKKQCKFLENLIIIVNSREKQSYSTSTENHLYTDIVRKASGLKLKVLFSGNQRVITLQKTKKDSHRSHRHRKRSRSPYETRYSEARKEINSNHRSTENSIKSDTKTKEDETKNESQAKEIVISDDDEISLTDYIDDDDYSSDDDYKVVSELDEASEHDQNDDLAKTDDVLIIDDEPNIEKNTIKDYVKAEDVPDLSPASSKRSRTCSESSETQAKRLKIYKATKIVAIQCADRETASKIQLSIDKNVEGSDVVLKCRGIVDGCLVYDCLKEGSSDFLQSLLNTEFPNLSVSVKENESSRLYKVSMRIFSYLDEEPKSLLLRIKKYNPNIMIEEWKILRVDKNDFTVLSLEIDEFSYKYICNENFCLYAGIDCVEFSRVW